MRKGLAGSAILASVMLAGCSSGGAETPPTGAGGDSSAMPTPTSKAGPQRTAPAKSLALPDKCAVVAEEQWRFLGADQPPQQLESNGKQGCKYQSGAAGTTAGWIMFIAVDPNRTMQEYADSADDATSSNINGYPAVQVDNGSGCLTTVDVSDKGSLFINNISRADEKACELSKKFAKAALENLPNAGA